MADELIKRSAVLDALDDFSFCENDAVRLKKRMENYLWMMPTVDAVPVAHGHWTEQKVFYHEGVEMQSGKCSVCGKYHTTLYFYSYDSFPYCPNCGADMRDGKDKA